MSPASPAPLPGAPVLETLFLENAWILPTLLGLGAAIALAWRATRAGRTASGCLALAAIATGLVERGVVTQRERIAASTRALVGLVARADAAGADALLAEDAVVRLGSGRSELAAGSRDEILRRIETDMRGAYALREHSIREVQASVDGPRVGRTRVRVRVVPEATRVPSSAWVRLDWRLDKDEIWRVRAITIEQVDGLAAW